ncbi:Protein of unknown function [Saccharopolyspora antimicrobica]|uniref:Uncharacterized protein DUF3105 n=1 Tax=Saccharopolyspora antimicrobica TaxID=455193 RepID=A0A1I5BZX7_9PSEU|nr:DUF3105 domain-containing protein [Saccharopolyspora antimicrobica]RKT89033.1 uncharacterized protein DUF3105 [Saccharopolyspora antimicrobica]SFN79911.1 Protein of unknown function [Saccharopolyspora antimicrobica]
MKRAGTGKQASKALAGGGGLPWAGITAVAVVLAFAGGIFGYVYVQYADKTERDAAMAKWTPSEANRDPARQIPGVVVEDYEAGKHVDPAQRVNYDYSPAFGGPHDGIWAACEGTVYEVPVRTENLVHSLEHGAVWIAYDPERVDGAALDALRAKVDGQQYMALSPYPGLDQRISLQSWGRQLKLADAGDPRIDQFISSTRTNPYTHPEVGASCSALGPGGFDPDSPPPFDPNPPGPDAVPMAAGRGAAGQEDPA